ncbi:MAG: hypothetical protein AB7T63_06685 [Planctomycetota bacterium]
MGCHRDLAPEPDAAPGDRGLLPDGTAADGLAGLRARLMASPDLQRRFAAQGGHRFSAYVHAVVQSVPFRWRAVRVQVGNAGTPAREEEER